MFQLTYPRVFLPKQKEVLEAVHKYPNVLYSGAFGAGKTLLLANVIIRECLTYPNSLWLVGSQTVPQLRDTVVKTFLEEVDLYQSRLAKAEVGLNLCKKWKPSTMTYQFYNKSEILFRSCDKPSKFKSINLDGAAIDEPVDIDEDVFLMIQGRLRAKHTKHRFVVMAGNPAGKTNWVYRKFFESGDRDYKVIHTTTYDNSFLPDGYIRNMEQSYDADYARRYLQGEWGSFEGQVYKDFSYDKHVGNFRSEQCKYYVGGFDDGYRNPACFLVVGVGADNEIYVMKEFYRTGLTSRELADEVAIANAKYHFSKVFCDPSGQNAIAEMRNLKVRAADANNDIDSGIAKLKSMFRNDLIFIDKSCVNLIKELESYRYEKDKYAKNLTEKPIAKDNHAVDALRYSVSEFNPYRKKTLMKVGNWRRRDL